MIPGQMTIFDFLKPEEPSLEGMTGAEAARLIGDRLGLVFSECNSGEWLARYKKMRITVDMDRYDTNDSRDGKAFIGVGLCEGLCGGGIPADSISEAVGWLKKKGGNE